MLVIKATEIIDFSDLWWGEKSALLFSLMLTRKNGLSEQNIQGEGGRYSSFHVTDDVSDAHLLISYRFHSWHLNRQLQTASLADLSN